jgi:glycine cleavage system H protein
LADRRYSETHEWVTVEGSTATVGITDYAQAQLGDVVFLELPSPGKRVAAGDSFGVIESVKAASDLYSPVEGTVAEVNERLAENPELVNGDPFGEGWLMKVELAGELPGALLDEEAYRRLTQGSGG